MVNRAHPRFAVAIDATFHVGSTKLVGRTTNVSGGGLCANLDRSIPLGEGVVTQVALVFPDNDVSEAIEIGGRVVWCTPLGDEFQVGMQFTNVSADAARDLKLFLRFLAARPE